MEVSQKEVAAADQALKSASLPAYSELANLIAGLAAIWRNGMGAGKAAGYQLTTMSARLAAAQGCPCDAASSLPPLDEDASDEDRKFSVDVLVRTHTGEMKVGYYRFGRGTWGSQQGEESDSLIELDVAEWFALPVAGTGIKAPA